MREEEPAICDAESPGKAQIQAAAEEICFLVEKHGGLCFGVFVAYSLPCSKKPNMFHDELEAGIEEGLDPEDVVALRARVADYLERLNAMYPPT